MGDKYETSREMVQQEINNLQIQLTEIIRVKNSLKSISVNPHQNAGLGSLVETDKGLFYIAVSLGMIDYGKKENIFNFPGKSTGKSNERKNGKRNVLTEWNSTKNYKNLVNLSSRFRVNFKDRMD